MRIKREKVEERIVLNRWKRRVTAVLFLLCIWMAIPYSALSLGQPDLTLPCELVLQQTDPVDGTPFRDIGFTIYRIAYMRSESETWQYDYTESFAGNGMPLQPSAEGFAEHLAAFAGNNGLTGMSKESDEGGTVRFSDPDAGLYLIVQHRSSAGYYAARPFLVSLPMQTADGSDWIYSVHAEPKTAPVPTVPQTMSFSVIKRWEDADHGDRPDHVSVALCRDGIPVETVSLSKQTDWTCTWHALDAAHVWSVAEVDVPKGYAVQYEIDSDRVSIINIKTEMPTPTPKPPLVQTGFRTRALLYAGTAGLVLLLIGSLAIVGKRKP